MHRLREDSSLNLCTGQPPTECDDTRCCIIQFDLLMMRTQCSKHVEEYNKLTKNEPKICALRWSVAKIILRCTVSKT